MIAIGCDHGGFNHKQMIIKYFEENNIEFLDCGTFEPVSCDYPDIAEAVCNSILDGSCDKGILVCGTGIGMSIAANKIDGIRAAHCTDTYSARMSRQHNNAHILCLGERITGCDLALDIVKEFLGAEFLGDRHQKRVDKIMALEK